MKNMPITTTELNSYVLSVKRSDGPLPLPKRWVRLLVGDTDVYVGDNNYVIAVVYQAAKNMSAMRQNCKAAENTIVKYLIAEGFIGPEH